MNFSILVTVTRIQTHKYLDTPLTDGAYRNNHTEYVTFQNVLIPALACFKGFLLLK